MEILLADINSIQKSVKGLEILTKGVGFSCCKILSFEFLFGSFFTRFFNIELQTKCTAASNLVQEIIQITRNMMNFYRILRRCLEAYWILGIKSRNSCLVVLCLTQTSRFTNPGLMRNMLYEITRRKFVKLVDAN